MLIKLTQPQCDLQVSMKEWSQVIKEVECNYATAMQGAHHVIHLI